MVAQVECPPESLEWFAILRSDPHECDELFLAVTTYNYKVSSLCPRIRQLGRYGTAADIISGLTTILSEIDSVEKEFQSWLSSDSPSSIVQPADLPKLYIWNVYRSTRCRLHQFTINLLDSLTTRRQSQLIIDVLPLSSLTQRRQDSIQVLVDMAQEILRTIPYALGSATANHSTSPAPPSWADALRLLWPLAVVSWLPLILPRQREMAQAGLKIMGREMGIKQALEINNAFSGVNRSTEKT
jgi:hypothetical protein